VTPGALPGEVVKLTYDSPLHKLTEGDYLQTPTGRLYEVLAVRVQEKGKHAGRQHLTAIVSSGHPPDVNVYPLHWYPRGSNRGPKRS
jgi:hypothetical protein